MRITIKVVFAFLLVFSGCRSISSTQEIEISSQAGAYRDAMNNESLLGIAVLSGSFQKFTNLIQKAGLSEMLDHEGPYTLFAPTDEAFELFPEAKYKDLLKSQNREELIRILEYHIIRGEVMTDSLLQCDTLSSELGASLIITESEEGIIVNDAHLVKADTKATNGVIQIINRVLLPPEQ